MKRTPTDVVTALTAYGLGAGKDGRGTRLGPVLALPLPGAGSCAPLSRSKPRGIRRALQAAPQGKGTVMKAIARFFDWLNSGIAEGQRRRQEAYLAQASDHCDLEYRIRELEREPLRLPDWW